VLLCLLSDGFGQPRQPTEPEVPRGGSPVKLGDRTLFEINWGLETFPTEDRARAVSERLRRVAEDPAADTNVRIVESEVTMDLMAGDVPLVSVFQTDAEIAGTTQRELAESWAAILREALPQYRDDHRRSAFVVGVGWTTLTLALCILAITGLYRLARMTSENVAAKAHARIREKRGVGGISREHVVKMTWRLARVIWVVGALAILYAAFELVLSYFPKTRFISREMMHGVADPIRSFGYDLWRSLPSLLFIALIVWCTIQLIRLVQFIFVKISQGEFKIEGFHPTWANTTQRLVSLTLIILAMLIAYPYIPGSSSPAFKGVTLFLGLLISLGSTGLISNLLTGILLTYTDAFQVGDLVRVGETTGVVDRTSMLVTRIRNRHNQLITIPNSLVLASHVTNFRSSDDGDILITAQVGIGYDVPWRQVEELLKLAAYRTQGLRKDPPPHVLKASLDQFRVIYELSSYVEPGLAPFAVQSELNANVLDACNEYAVQILVPAYESDRETPAIVPRDRWYAPPVREKAS
jgi:small-conductance mechanosensitive channel